MDGSKQPGGLPESSRWSQTTGLIRQMEGTPEGCKRDALAPLAGCESSRRGSGGLRCAATTSYYLAALRADQNAQMRQAINCLHTPRPHTAMSETMAQRDGCLENN